jgi:hypothetical protein
VASSLPEATSNFRFCRRLFRSLRRFNLQNFSMLALPSMPSTDAVGANSRSSSMLRAASANPRWCSGCTRSTASAFNGTSWSDNTDSEETDWPSASLKSSIIMSLHPVSWTSVAHLSTTSGSVWTPLAPLSTTSGSFSIPLSASSVSSSSLELQPSLDYEELLLLRRSISVLW